MAWARGRGLVVDSKSLPSRSRPRVGLRTGPAWGWVGGAPGGAMAGGARSLPPPPLAAATRRLPARAGTIGHVAHGKSTVVKAISGVQTVRFKNELERNITIKLGYANAKVGGWGQGVGVGGRGWPWLCVCQQGGRRARREGGRCRRARGPA